MLSRFYGINLINISKKYKVQIIPKTTVSSKSPTENSFLENLYIKYAMVAEINSKDLHTNFI